MERTEQSSHGTNRRSFMLKGVAIGAGAAGVGRLFADPPSASAHGGLTKGDVAILQFLAAAELLEADLWAQYNEPGGVQDSEVPGGSGNPAYTAALAVLDEDMDQYIHDNADDEQSHANFIKRVLEGARGGSDQPRQVPHPAQQQGDRRAADRPVDQPDAAHRGHCRPTGSCRSRRSSSIASSRSARSSVPPSPTAPPWARRRPLRPADCSSGNQQSSLPPSRGSRWLQMPLDAGDELRRCRRSASIREREGRRSGSAPHRGSHRRGVLAARSRTGLGRRRRRREAPGSTRHPAGSSVMSSRASSPRTVSPRGTFFGSAAYDPPFTSIRWSPTNAVIALSRT
jgi:hypothetical protein